MKLCERCWIVPEYQLLLFFFLSLFVFSLHVSLCVAICGIQIDAAGNQMYAVAVAAAAATAATVSVFQDS